MEKIECLDENMDEEGKDKKEYQTEGLIFGVEDRPPIYITIFYAFQVKPKYFMIRQQLVLKQSDFEDFLKIFNTR